MRLTQRFIDLQRLHGRRSSLGTRFARRKNFVVTEHGIAFGESGISQAIARILVDGLLEELVGLLEQIRGPAVPVVAALEVKLVSLGILGGAPGHPLLLFAARTQAELVRDLPGDIFLHRQNLSELAVVLLTPKL